MLKVNVAVVVGGKVEWSDCDTSWIFTSSSGTGELADGPSPSQDSRDSLERPSVLILARWETEESSMKGQSARAGFSEKLPERVELL